MIHPNQSIYRQWLDLSLPPQGTGYTALQVPNTNSWIFKSETNGFGLLLVGVVPPIPAPSFKNIDIAYKPEKILITEGNERLLERCVEVQLDPACDQRTMARLLERLVEDSPDGRYTTDLLVKILKDVAHLFEPPEAPPSKDEVMGVWGELQFLLIMIRRVSGPAYQRKVISSWEPNQDFRDIIDFLFSDARIAVEVKTSGSKRAHHIRGIFQVTVPEGFKSGYLASLSLDEARDGRGRSCSDLKKEIEETFIGSEGDQTYLKDEFARKTSRRGKAALDEKYHFHMKGELLFFPFDDVPRPPETRNVLDVQWIADFSGLLPEEEGFIDGLVREIATS